MTWRRRSARRRDLAAMVRDLCIPDPFDLNEFVAGVAARRGRPVQVEPCPPETARSGVCGAWLGTEDIDYVFAEADTSPLHREHIIVHEIAHMLCGHRRRAEALLPLFPHLDPDLVVDALARSSYDDAQEREAEEFASALMARVCRPASPAGSDVALDRASRVLRPRRR